MAIAPQPAQVQAKPPKEKPSLTEYTGLRSYLSTAGMPKAEIDKALGSNVLTTGTRAENTENLIAYLAEL
jgi:hypothetical protein